MNKIVFSFDSEANWSDDEIDELNAILADAVRGIDDDAVEGSYDTVCKATGNEAAPVVSDAVKKQIIEEFLDGVQVEYQVQARFRNEDGETQTSVSSTGYLK